MCVLPSGEAGAEAALGSQFASASQPTLQALWRNPGGALAALAAQRPPRQPMAPPKPRPPAGDACAPPTPATGPEAALAALAAEQARGAAPPMTAAQVRPLLLSFVCICHALACLRSCEGCRPGLVVVRRVWMPCFAPCKGASLHSSVPVFLMQVVLCAASGG